MTSATPPDASATDLRQPPPPSAANGRWVDAGEAQTHFSRTARTLREWAKDNKIERTYDDGGSPLYWVAEAGGDEEETSAAPSDKVEAPAGSGGDHTELFRQVEGERDHLRRLCDDQQADLAEYRRQISAKDEDLRETRQRLDGLTVMVMGHLAQLPPPSATVDASDTPAEAPRKVIFRGANGNRGWFARVFRRPATA